MTRTSIKSVAVHLGITNLLFMGKSLFITHDWNLLKVDNIIIGRQGAM